MPLAARYGVLGWPVAHSRSPAMFAALGLPYQLLPVPPELFAETVRALGAAGFGGANVTIPHKEAALALADAPSARARAIGAANTLTFSGDGAIAAENTDAPGLIAALPVAPAGKTALVLGAGGSARAAVWALLDAGAHVRVLNRSAERAQQLAGDLGAEPVTRPAEADLLINCTSVGLDDADAMPLADITGFGAVVDLVYRPGDTALIRAARARGVPAVGGLAVLVEQGALSYRGWTGSEPDREAMLAAADAQ